MTIHELIIDRFTVLYGEPRSQNIDAFHAEYIRAFHPVERSLLSSAVDRVVAEHEYHNWPTVGDISKAIRTIGDRRRADAERNLNLEKQRQEALRDEQWGRPSADSRARVDELMASFRATMKALDEKNHPREALPRTDRNAWAERFGMEAA